ncbi:imidazoleglycerol-phosphate dehydratase HisB [Sulfobacillus harzensis]|uniref:Imidazoleglycerol-phosphate dehydratase n=1 Tax=Sulfobacillus harzensis TaxID=2729629 RepID=A0A7Y0Q4T5_9FIRM|nr:imidazoleglycerol-phosphate dehydratase HisB [Sulfobacillus harzensis]NMP24740.1 imidazoleglycerol-phosphate dehydratase HisB [Sulfobacillus harzensis]
MGRMAEIQRETRETRIDLAVDLDAGQGSKVKTNLPIFSHFFDALAFHSRFSLTLEAEGDVAVDPHHLVEDVGIVLGQGIRQALGGQDFARFGDVVQPMDEALVLVVVDISGRGQLYWGSGFPDRAIGGVSAEVWPEFFNGLARNLNATIHVRMIAGENAHHVYEACFKGLGRALWQATRSGWGGVASTKGVL